MIIPRPRSRLEGFSDAVIAFALVLLVLSLGVPKGYEELVRNLRGFPPFALTFAALLMVWVAHKNLFRRYPLDDAFSIVVNSVLLFTILFYAYPLRYLAGSLVSLLVDENHQLLANQQQLQNMFMIYGLGWMLVFFCISLLYLHAARISDELGLSEIEEYDARSDGFFYLCFVLGGGISVAFAAFDVGVDWGLPAIAYISIGVFAGILVYIRGRNRPDELAAAIFPTASPEAVIPDAPYD